VTARPRGGPGRATDRNIARPTAESGYFGVQMIARALETTKGDVENFEAFLGVSPAVRLGSPADQSSTVCAKVEKPLSMVWNFRIGVHLPWPVVCSCLTN